MICERAVDNSTYIGNVFMAFSHGTTHDAHTKYSENFKLFWTQFTESSQIRNIRRARNSLSSDFDSETRHVGCACK